MPCEVILYWFIIRFDIDLGFKESLKCVGSPLKEATSDDITSLEKAVLCSEGAIGACAGGDWDSIGTLGCLAEQNG